MDLALRDSIFVRIFHISISLVSLSVVAASPRLELHFELYLLYTHALTIVCSMRRLVGTAAWT